MDLVTIRRSTTIKMASAIRMAIREWPHMARALVRVDLRPREGIEGLALDQYYRLYFDPEYVEERPLDHLMLDVLLKIVPLVLRHGPRIKRILDHTEDERKEDALNKLAMCSQMLAIEVVANSVVIPDGHEARKFSIELPDGTPITMGSLESMYRSIMDYGLGDEMEVKEGEDGKPMMLGGPISSSLDHDQKPWDDPPPLNKFGKKPLFDYSVTPREQERISRDVSSNLDLSEFEGEAEQLADLRNIQISAKDMLKFAIRASGAQTKKGDDYSTYRRPSRRPTTDGYFRPSYESQQLNLCVIVDTSGSMTPQEREAGIAVVDSALKEMELDTVRVVSGDDCLRTDQKVSSANAVAMAGNGGTDMDLIYRKVCDLTPKPDVIILVTDGQTPWPDHLPVPLVAAITDAFNMDELPTEIRGVSVVEEIYANC